MKKILFILFTGLWFMPPLQSQEISVNRILHIELKSDYIVKDACFNKNKNEGVIMKVNGKDLKTNITSVNGKYQGNKSKISDSINFNSKINIELYNPSKKCSYQFSTDANWWGWGVDCFIGSKEVKLSHTSGDEFTFSFTWESTEDQKYNTIYLYRRGLF